VNSASKPENGHPTILIHAEAPPKPALGEPCNGCGLCCLAEPCPVGMLLSRRRRGRCISLRWDEVQRRYRCGALAWQAKRSLTRLIERPLHAWMARMISAGQGCDAELQAQALGDADQADGTGEGKP
jgi:Fe-S-cluster-containing hydrogenase component 2